MTSPERGWRFLLPGLDAPDEAAGLQVAATGALAMVEGDDAIRQALLLLVSTRPGERVMRPDYGASLHRLTFSPNDDTTAGLAMHYVRRAVERWEPRVEVLRVDAGRVPEEATKLEIVLDYRVRATQRAGRLAFQLALQEGLAA